MAGYCLDKDYSKKIIKSTKNKNFISLLNQNLDKPISHTILLQELQKTDFVILPYLFNKSTQNCIPTKFYECLAYKKPMLISKNSKWESFINPLDAGMFVDFEDEELKNEMSIITEKIISQKFYTKTIDEKIWKFDGEIIRKVI